MQSGVGRVRGANRIRGGVGVKVLASGQDFGSIYSDSGRVSDDITRVY